MGCRIYDVQLQCGCMIAHDSGYPSDVQGDGGLLPCYWEYAPSEIERVEGEKNCDKSWDEHYKNCVQCGDMKNKANNICQVCNTPQDPDGRCKCVNKDAF